ncbi:hypothetical protein ACFFHF_17090 [Robertmurraya beringensis]|uniref:Uncharacterized protein n=1 Tax=Robertmurraya beringensis TaxID=641660 RepID=A0ABV6KUB3_9BACI
MGKIIDINTIPRPVDLTNRKKKLEAEQQAIIEQFETIKAYTRGILEQSKNLVEESMNGLNDDANNKK